MERPSFSASRLCPYNYTSVPKEFAALLQTIRYAADSGNLDAARHGLTNLPERLWGNPSVSRLIQRLN